MEEYFDGMRILCSEKNYSIREDKEKNTVFFQIKISDGGQFEDWWILTRTFPEKYVDTCFVEV
jgi:hypothetical protein